MSRSALVLLTLVAGAAGAAAQSPASSTPPAASSAAGPAAPAMAPSPMPPAPELGQPAPDFTAAWADSAGPRSTPVTLAGLRGKVVVLAFYPRDRTSGCTAELTKFRDEFTTLFGRTGDVVVLPISVDDLASHSAWSSEMRFPFALASDPSLEVAERYGSRRPGSATASRTAFVIGRDGRIVYRDLRFNALSEEPYTRLAAAVAAAR